MTQPTFSDGPPVPIMVEGVMYEAMLRQFFTDLETHTAVVNIREKNASVINSFIVEKDLNALLDKLLTGKTRGAQIRYVYDGVDWTDTVFVSPQGFKIVRCRHDDS